jgi:hypothetical protein
LSCTVIPPGMGGFSFAPSAARQPWSGGPGQPLNKFGNLCATKSQADDHRSKIVPYTYNNA